MFPRVGVSLTFGMDANRASLRVAEGWDESSETARGGRAASESRIGIMR